MIHTKLPLAIRTLRRLLDETEDRSNTRYGDLTSNERDALEVLIAHAEVGGPADGNPCLTCRHWNHIQGRVLGACTSDSPSEEAEGLLYTDAQTRRPCWEGMP